MDFLCAGRSFQTINTLVIPESQTDYCSEYIFKQGRQERETLFKLLSTGIIKLCAKVLNTLHLLEKGS